MAKTPRRLTLEITQEDIDNAMHRNSNRCAIADCITRTIPGASRVLVDLQTIRFTVDGERRTYFTPRPAAQYLIMFDAGRTVAPRPLRLDKPVQVRKAGVGASTKVEGITTSEDTRRGDNHVTKIGGSPMPRVQGRSARREFGSRSYPDNELGPDGRSQSGL